MNFIRWSDYDVVNVQMLNLSVNQIAWVTTGLVLATSITGATAVYLLADYIPFMQAMSITGRIAVALLAGAILVARSPSSAIAIVNELRAKGPFTQTVLGVTVIMDVVVILLFAFNSEIADALLTNLRVNIGFVVLLLIEISISLTLGFLLGKLLQFILSRHLNSAFKAGIVLLSGYAIFLLSTALRHYSHANWPFEVLLEPLLICMIGSFVVINWTPYRDEMLKILHDIGPAIYIAFFTLTGASLALDILAQTWPIALALFIIRLLAIFIGSFVGGAMAGEPVGNNAISWMAYVTQAGVGLGLAKEVAVEFPEFGAAFATIIISVIVLNQIVGPPLFKWVIDRVGEAHPRGETAEFDGVRDALIFGVDDQALAVARQLAAHNWQVKLACLNEANLPKTGRGDVQICPLPQISREALDQLDAGYTDAVVLMLTDEENYQIGEMFFENYGTDSIVVRLNDRTNFARFHELGALIVDPGTAIVSLLDQFVRSPSAASLLLGLEEGQQVIDVEVCASDLHGMPLRDLRLPLDTLILSVRRNNYAIVSHGYTRLELGDKVTVVGAPDSLEEVMLKFTA